MTFSADHLRACILVLLGGVCLLAATAPGVSAGGTPITVDSTSDAAGGSCTVAGECTFRNAILAANSNVGPDTIVFDQTVFSPQNATIAITSPLPHVDASQGITIDGLVDNVAKIHLNDQSAGDTAGLVIESAPGMPATSITLKSVAVSFFDREGIYICGGLSGSDCLNDVSDVVLQGVESYFNHVTGIVVSGVNLTNVEATTITANTNGVGGGVAQGLWIDASGSASGVSVVGGLYSSNSRNGVLVNGSSLTDLDLESLTLNANGTIQSVSSGLWVQSSGDISDVNLTNVDILGPQDAGRIFAEGAFARIHVTDLTAETGFLIDGNGAGEDVSVADSHFDFVCSNCGGLDIGVDASTLATASVTGNELSGGSIRVGCTDAGVGGVTIADNIVTGGHLLLCGSPMTDVLVEGNEISESPDNEGGAITAYGSPGSNVVVRENMLHDNAGDGIQIGDEAIDGDTSRITASRNSSYLNDGIGINLLMDGETAGGVTPNDPADADGGPNGLLNFPVLVASDGTTLTGTACAGCLVELFRAEDVADETGHGEPFAFMQDVTANGSGDFSAVVCGLGLPAGTRLTATATDASGNTSEASLNFAVADPLETCPSPTPPPPPTSPPATPPPPTSPATTPPTTPSPTSTDAPIEVGQGDLDCDGEITPRDALFPMLYRLDLSLLLRTEPCPSLDDGGGGRMFADVNCDGLIDENDSVAILATYADVPLPVEDGCTPIGDLL